MKTIRIRIESDKNAELLKQVLENTHFEKKIEAFEEDEELEDEELLILEERWETYLSNPSSAVSMDDFKKELSWA